MIGRRSVLKWPVALLAPDGKRGTRVAVKPENPVVGGTVLRRAAIQSPNYSPGVTGWIIKQDGSAEFNNVTVRGTVTSGHFIGTGEGTEVLIYSGAPAANNLIASITSAAFTDAFGNIGLPGIVDYFTSGGTFWAIQTFGGAIQFYTAATFGPWAVPATIGLSAAGGNLGITAQGNLNLSSVGGQVEVLSQLTATAGTAASPTLISTDTWHAMTLLNSWANVAGFATARYRLTAFDQVEVIAAISAAAATAATFFTLPAAYRPASQQPVGGAGASGNVPAGLAPWCRVDTGGNLTVQNTGAVGAAWQFFVHGYISLDA